MSINKNALTRYIALDKCLRNTYKEYTITDLTKACNEALLEINPDSTGVSKRTVYKDLDFMQDPLGYDAEIVKTNEGRFVYYRYADTTFSITSSALSVEEAQSLKLTIEMLNRFQGLPEYEWLDEIQTKLEDKFLQEGDNNKLIFFDESEDFSGKVWIKDLYAAIQNKQVLTITYQPFGKELTSFIVHPYILKEYNNRWFLIGLNNTYQTIQNIALDRIQEFCSNKVNYIPSEEDWSDYFYDVVGVSIPHDQPKERIQLLFHNAILPLIATKPIHGSQRIRTSENEWTEVDYDLIINNEFYRQIIAWGSSVKVIAPEHLKQRVIEEVKRLSLSYNIG